MSNQTERIEDDAKVKALEEAITELRRLIEFAADYPAEGSSRRTEDGYPAEVVYDEFAYKRMVDSFREALRRMLPITERALSPKEPQQ